MVIFGGRTLLHIALKKAGEAGLDPSSQQTRLLGEQVASGKSFDAGRRRSGIKCQCRGGQRDISKVSTCHTVEKRGRKLVGPNLWDIVGLKVGELSGFAYSPSLAKHGGKWTFEELARYLHDPKAAILGNKMAFPRVKDDAELADLLANLRTLSDTPAPVPN